MQKIKTTKLFRAVLLLSMVLHISFLAKADDKNIGTLKGIVYTMGEKPAVGAVATIKGSKKTALTDNEGVFTFSLEEGSYDIVISLTGYKTVVQSVKITTGRTTTMNVTMALSNTNLGEVVVSGGKNRYKDDELSNSMRLNTPLKEIPQNIQMVSNVALADQQVISMSDGVTRNVSGVTRLEHWGDMYTRINMRGSRVPAFRNGVNLNSNWGPLTEDMSFVDHIEFVKGPAGFMLANGDPSGLYNVVTKKPTGNGFNGQAGFTIGSFNLYRTTLDLDGNFDKAGKASYRLNLMGQTKGSFRQYEYNDRYSIAPVVRFQLDDRTMLTLEYTLQHAKMSNVGSYYLFSKEGYATADRDVSPLLAGLEPTVIDDHSVFVNLQHQINKDWKVTAQTAYFNYTQQGASMWPSSVSENNKLIRNVSVWDAASEIKSGQVYLNGIAHTGSIDHRIVAGVDVGSKKYWADWGQVHDLDSAGAEFDQNNPNNAATPVNGFPEFDRSIPLKERAGMTNTTMNQDYAGLYLQDELGFFENKLRLTIAGRFTYASQASYGGEAATASHVTPRIGLSYTVDQNTSVYALYDQAFIPQSGLLRGGGDIKPVTGNNMEAGIKRDWFDGKWNSTLSIYRITKNNELTTDPANAAGESYSIVLGEKVAQGVEVDIKGEITRGLNLIVNYAYTDSRVTKVSDGVTSMKVGDKVAGFATHTANAWISYRLMNGPLKGIGISLGGTYMGDRTTWSWGEEGVLDLPDYFRLDGGLFWERGRVRVAANVYNLLNDYLYSGSYYGYGNYYYWQAEAPINGRLSVSYNF